MFNRAILQSGSAYVHWAYAENVTEKTNRVAEILGCPTSNSEEIVKCLRSRPGKKIAECGHEFMVTVLEIVVVAIISDRLLISFVAVAVKSFFSVWTNRRISWRGTAVLTGYPGKANPA